MSNSKPIYRYVPQCWGVPSHVVVYGSWVLVEIPRELCNGWRLTYGVPLSWPRIMYTNADGQKNTYLEDV